MSDNANVGIDAVSYWLPPAERTLAELEARGQLRSTPETLAGFGFRHARVAEHESHAEMALEAARALIDEMGIDPAEIDVLLYASALTSSSTMTCGAAPNGAMLHMRDLSEFFLYPVSFLQNELDLGHATVAGVDQLGCASIFSAIRMARAMVLAEENVRTVLCVSADRLPAAAPREVIYNVISDGACAALVRRGAVRNRIIAQGQVTRGAYWDATALEDEIVAAYFPTARALIDDTLCRAGLRLDDIRWIIPHNVSLRSWEILLGLLDCPREKLFASNIARIGHTIAADNLINLRDTMDAGLLQAGDRLLLFTFGYGLNWSCMVVEH